MKKSTYILGALFLLLLGSAGLWLGYKEYREIRELRGAGVETTGEVTSSSYRKGRLTRSYHLTVEFQPKGGGKLVLNREVPEETYDAFKNGGTVKVRYLAADPEVCAYGDKELSPVPMFLTGGGLLVLALIFMASSWGKGGPEQAKNDAVNQGDATRLEAHGYAPVQQPVKEYPHADHDFYHRTMKQLEEFGFRYLGDEKLTSVQANTFLRYLVSQDGLMYASCYCLKPGLLAGLLGAKECRTVEFGSALAGGTFVNTSNAENLQGIKYPTLVDAEYHNPGMTVPELIQRHRQRMQTYVAGGGQVVVLKSLHGVHQVENAEQKVKAMWRKNPEVSEEELRAVARTALAGLGKNNA